MARARAIVALTVLAMLAFAANSLLCRLALRDDRIDAATFTAVRIASGALVLWPLARRSGSAWSPRAAFALFAYAAGFSFAYVALEAGTGALLLFGAVQITMIGYGRLRGERSSWLQAIGILAALAGVVLLVAPGTTAPPPGSAALMVVAGIAWGAYSIFGRGASAPVVATARNFALATPLALGVVAVAWLARVHIHTTPAGFALAAASGGVTSGLGYVAWYAALPGLGATRAATVQLTVPAIAAFGGVVLLGETLTARLAGSAALTIGGVALAVLTPRVGTRGALR